jgi:hypothetical protein
MQNDGHAETWRAALSMRSGRSPPVKASQHQFEVCTIDHDITTVRIFIEVIKYDLKIPVIQMAAHAQHAWMDVFRRKAFDHGRIFGEKHRMHEGGTPPRYRAWLDTAIC